MPEAGRIGSLIFYIYCELGERHHLPHVNVVYGRERANIEIKTGKLLSGSLPPRQMRVARKMVEKNNEKLLAMWNKLN